MSERIYTAAEKLAELDRELAMRRRVYPRLVSQNKLKPQQAEERIAVLTAIADDYREQMKRERLL